VSQKNRIRPVRYFFGGFLFFEKPNPSQGGDGKLRVLKLYFSAGLPKSEMIKDSRAADGNIVYVTL
jgi:hypothetical protein